MIIGACGFGSTGSSAVSDYLKEYNSFQTIDEIEFSYVQANDGLIDLDFHVNNPHGRTEDSIMAIYRYRQLYEHFCKYYQMAGLKPEVFRRSVEDFLYKITIVSWYWNIIPPKMNFIERLKASYLYRTKSIIKYEKKNSRHWEGFPYSKVDFSVKPECFDEAAKQHIRELLEGMGANLSRPIVLDQPFAGNNPQACFKFYDDPYAIVVDRDPRDNYVFARTKLIGRNHFMAVYPVEDFVKYYRALRKNQPYLEQNDRVLQMKFEDMVYHYDEATKKIRDFLHLPDNPNPKSIFDPAISMPNTQVWKRFPQFAEDIEYIEKELPEYLFDYTGCAEPDPNAKMFFGKSPKNK